ncbi:hypothetical protein [Parabacteroides provencensis]|uniref:hypothetical protein n=1 Tax=Parabacteroides provencensis TaxID=1944636 RepID=UPI000C14D113|nr:hypothetical protein [Parabacteroides provencensis]
MGTLINATEAKKRSKILEDNYSANKESRVEEAIKVSLEKIDRNVRFSTNRGLKNISCIVDEDIREELNRTLIERGYTVVFRFIGGNRVKFFISW